MKIVFLIAGCLLFVLHSSCGKRRGLEPVQGEENEPTEITFPDPTDGFPEGETDPEENPEGNPEDDFEIIEPTNYLGLLNVKCNDGEALLPYSAFAGLSQEKLMAMTFAQAELTYVVQSDRYFTGDYLFWYFSDSQQKPAILAVIINNLDEAVITNTYLDGTDLSEKVNDVKANMICADPALENPLQ
ncbi:MAG: hypothetical protein CMP10_03255 [Zetaproteobacteria bacterium]|nr:hypothetical protein [Pseudobdellovibrionaceae bacterium]